MTEERRIEVEVEVPVSAEEAWEAIATGAGITAWFMPAEVEGEVGGTVVHHHDAEMSTSGTIIAYDPPHRFAYEEEADEAITDEDHGPRVMATEFLVEARSGSTCVVRVVMSGFGEGDAWDRAVESFTKGWRQALVSLRLYLTHFHGEAVGSINVGEVVKGHNALWQQFIRALGLPADASRGDHIVAAGPGVPDFAGRVEATGDAMLTLVLDRPARGIGLVGVGQVGDEAFMTVRAQLFGPETPDVATREQAAWKAWLSDFRVATGDE